MDATKFIEQPYAFDPDDDGHVVRMYKKFDFGPWIALGVTIPIVNADGSKDDILQMLYVKFDGGKAVQYEVGRFPAEVQKYVDEINAVGVEKYLADRDKATHDDFQRRTGRAG